MKSFSGKNILDSNLAIQLGKDFGRIYDVDAAQIPERFKTLSLDSLIPEMKGITDKIKQYFWDNKESIILFSKTPGAGKTVLAIAACFAGIHHLVNKNFYVAKYVSYKRIPSQSSIYRYDVEFWNQTLLGRTWIIDNVQIDRSKKSIDRIEGFKTLIENLYESNSKFIITTTMTRTERITAFGPDIVSRMDEMSVFLESTKINIRDNEKKASTKYKL